MSRSSSVLLQKRTARLLAAAREDPDWIIVVAVVDSQRHRSASGRGDQLAAPAEHVVGIIAEPPRLVEVMQELAFFEFPEGEAIEVVVRHPGEVVNRRDPGLGECLLVLVEVKLSEELLHRQGAQVRPYGLPPREDPTRRARIVRRLRARGLKHGRLSPDVVGSLPSCSLR
eukprot:CAMPEP_0197391306 /NCGR_PEP_ID=MMETSP1165-20131217/3006_1 /TAXON_ID=284809 /ORGANISM="Chrysocystis fragilis, Strain CCMP3189" /LENGTH=170 /DNA_ID=CAMNT_0042916881 /DNA_START=18 /DNA_END=530 /DNA_ORIENTATION=+